MIILFAIQIATQAIQTLLCIGELAFPNKLELEDGTITSAWIVGLALTFLLQLPVYILGIVFFLKWQHRAYKNLAVLSHSTLDTTPGWAVGYWFIPIVNLFKPYLTIREIWRKSDPDIDSRDVFSPAPPETPAALIFWWAFWIISNIASNIAVRVEWTPKTTDHSTVALLYGVMSFLTMIAAVLAILVVKSISERQTQRFEKLSMTDDDFQPPAPPTFE